MIRWCALTFGTLFIFSINSHADLSRAQFAASAAASFLNSTRTWADFLKQMDPVISVEDRTYLQKFLKVAKIPLSASLPKFRALNNNLYVENQVIEIQADSRIVYNGVSFNPNDATLEKFFGRLASEAAVRGQPACILISCAYAVSSEQLFMRTVKFFLREGEPGNAIRFGAVVAGMIAIKWVIVAGVAAVVIWGGKELYETLRDGEVVCKDSYFAIREKVKGRFRLATSKVYYLSADEVSTLTKSKVSKCEANSIGKLQEILDMPAILRPSPGLSR